MMWVLHEAALNSPACILPARELVRRAGALLGMEAGAQGRLALAVALAARAAFETSSPAMNAGDLSDGTHPGATSVESGGFAAAPQETDLAASVAATTTPALRLTLRITPSLLVAELDANAPAWASIAADDLFRQLADLCEFSERGRSTLRLGRTLRSEPQGLNLKPEDLGRLRDQLCIASGPVQELGAIDRELMTALVENDRLNAELEDTNRGVVALYAELEGRADQLRQASELKSRFLSNMSHEFRTPLNSILALARMLLDRTDGELTDEQDRQVGYIRRSAESLTDLVNDLLDLAKVEAGKLELRPQPFTVAALLSGLRGVMKPLQQSDAVELVFDEAAGSLRLFTDEAKVAQILRNLVSNALKFTEKGEVRVGASLADDGPGNCQTCVFTVRDTGIGIAPENQEVVFQEFSQVANRLQGRAKGTGLGLPLSRRLAELLGGTLTLESKPGLGSLFTLAIPTVLPGAQQDVPPTIVAAMPSGGVLLIDDEETSRYVLRQMLAGLPALRVLEAETGAQGLRQAAQHRPDVILLDLRMPGMDGYEVLERLGAVEGTQTIPVVICTSSVLDSDDRARLGRARAIVPKGGLSREIIAATLAPFLPAV